MLSLEGFDIGVVESPKKVQMYYVRNNMCFNNEFGNNISTGECKRKTYFTDLFQKDMKTLHYGHFNY